jgi:hypothetical protein
MFFVFYLFVRSRFLIRKAPGNDSFDFGQFVDFSPGSTSVNTPRV